MLYEAPGGTMEPIRRTMDVLAGTSTAVTAPGLVV
jgi:hypothetical protein